jgi:hypothetical protein
MYLGRNPERGILFSRTSVGHFLILPRSRSSLSTRSSSATTLYSLPPAVIWNAVLYPCSSVLSSRTDATRTLIFRVLNPCDGVACS